MISKFKRDHLLDLDNPYGSPDYARAKQEGKRRVRNQSRTMVVDRREESAVDLLPGRGQEIMVLTALPTSGLKAAKSGKYLGGFPVADAGAKFDCTPQEWNKRCDLVNEHAFVWTSKGVGRHPDKDYDLENATEEEWGNVRMDMTFAIRRGIMQGDGAEFDHVWSAAPAALQPKFEKAFPGVYLVGVGLHPPRRWRDADDRKTGRRDKDDPDQSTGLNLHFQAVLLRVFDGHHLSCFPKGFSHCLNIGLNRMQEDEMGVDVAAVEKAQHKKHLTEIFQELTEAELTEVNSKTGKPRFAPERVADALAVRAAVAAGTTNFESEIQKRANAKKSSLGFYKKNLEKSELAQPAVNYWLAKEVTEYLEKELVKMNPKWRDRFAWGRRAAKHVIETRAAGGFSRPHYAILKDFEAADAVREHQAEQAAKLAALAAEKEQITSNARLALENTEAMLGRENYALRHELDALRSEVAELKSNQSSPFTQVHLGGYSCGLDQISEAFERLTHGNGRDYDKQLLTATGDPHPAVIHQLNAFQAAGDLDAAPRVARALTCIRLYVQEIPARDHDKGENDRTRHDQLR